MVSRAPARMNARDWTARAMTEAEWQTLVEGIARAHGWWTHHQRDSRGSKEGWPDLVLVRDGDCMFVELKKHGGQLTDDQALVLERLHRAGQEVHVWYPRDEEIVRLRLARPRVAPSNDVPLDPYLLAALMRVRVR